jgi:hypothetical protein
MNYPENAASLPVNTINVDLSKTEPILTEKGGNIWKAGVILRKASKFVAGTAEDVIVPISVFYDPDTGQILEDVIPTDLREEFGVKE